MAYSPDTVDSVIIIDGLKPAEQKRTLEIIKRFHIPYQSIKGGRDTSDPSIRLADSIAGLVRDDDEGFSEMGKMLKDLSVSKLLVEIKK